VLASPFTHAAKNAFATCSGSLGDAAVVDEDGGADDEEELLTVAGALDDDVEVELEVELLTTVEVVDEDFELPELHAAPPANDRTTSAIAP